MRIYEVDSELQAKALSRQIFMLMYPATVANPGAEYLFNFDSRNGKTVIYIDPEMVIPIYVKADFAETIFTIGKILNGYISETQGSQLKELLLNSDSVKLGDLIPDNLPEVDNAFLIQYGFKQETNSAI